MRYAIVGPGRVGTALISDLGDAGFELAGVMKARPEPEVKKANGRECRSEHAMLSDWSAISARAQVVFITVPDDALPGVAQLLAGIPGARAVAGATVLHCSGALGSDVLQPLRGQGWHLGSLHPLQSISAGDRGQLFNISWGIEGDDAAIVIAQRVVAALGGRCLSIAAAQKPVYHAAAVMASNYVVTLSSVAARLLTALGIPMDDAVTALLPLMQGVLNNVTHYGVPAALTGPLERGDAATVKRHRDVLTADAMPPDVWRLYQLLGIATVNVALDKGTIDHHAAEALRVLLGSGSDE